MALTLCRTRARYRVLKSITLCRGEDEIVAIGTHQLGGHHEREGIQLIFGSARLGSARARCVSRAYSFVVTFGLRNLTRRLLLCRRRGGSSGSLAGCGALELGSLTGCVAPAVWGRAPQPVLVLSLRPS